MDHVRRDIKHLEDWETYKSVKMELCLMSVVCSRESRKSCGEACCLKKLEKGVECVGESIEDEDGAGC